MRLTSLYLALALCAAWAVCGATPEPPPSIPLVVNLRFTYTPTMLGLVAPGDPSGYGELFVRVVETGAGRCSVRYEVKEEVPPATLAEDGTAEAPPASAADGEVVATPAPLGANKPVTRIRRGVIVTTGMGQADTIAHPFVWGDGDWETDSSLVWLSQATFTALKSTDEASWNASFTGYTDQTRLDQLNAYVEQTAAAQGADATVKLLVASPQAAYPCMVNGANVRLPALYLRDSLGLMEYWVLDDPANPLVLKAGFIAPSLAGGAAAADVATPAADATPVPEQVTFGLGYAITVLDF